MRFLKIIFALIFCFTFFEGQAQHYIGISAGGGGGSIRLFPEKETGMLWGLGSGGVSYKYFGDDKYVSGVGADFLFLQQGFTEEVPLGDDTTRVLSRKVNSLMLPIFWQPHVNMFKGKVRVYLNIGLTLSYNISSNYIVESEQYGLIAEGKYDMMLVRDNRWGYGLCGGFGINYVSGRFEFGAEGRYYYGYSDIMKSRIKYEENPLRSPLDNINISLSLHYRLGKGRPKKGVKNSVTIETIKTIEKL